MKHPPVYYIGCDLHIKHMNFCVTDARPRKQEYPLPPACIVSEQEIAATPPALGAYLRRLRKTLLASAHLHLLVESTANWFWVVDAAQPLVQDITLVNALKAAHISHQDAKTDKLDARKLAWLAHIPTLSQQILAVEEHIRNKGLFTDVMTRILASLPGFGPILALHARLEIGAIERFPSHAKFVKYCSLAPKTELSQTTDTGRGLIRGNAFLKYLFIEAGMHVKTHPAFAGLAQRRAGAMSANINIGRKLAICAYFCLSRNTMFAAA